MHAKAPLAPPSHGGRAVRVRRRARDAGRDAVHDGRVPDLRRERARGDRGHALDLRVLLPARHPDYVQEARRPLGGDGVCDLDGAVYAAAVGVLGGCTVSCLLVGLC